MNDPRTTLILDGVASAALEGVVEADSYAETRPARCMVPAAGIMRAPDAASEQMDQIIFGEAFDILAERDGFAFGQALRDGYVGWVDLMALREGVIAPTHWVCAPSTLVFEIADLKSRNLMSLSMNSLLAIEMRDGRYAKIEGSGWVVEDHLQPITLYDTDPVKVAAQFCGAPYLWGGRVAWGVDCSGLVQQARYACGLSGERDSDMQSELGEAVSADDLRHGDLVFWKGHVGLITDTLHLLHANAHHMATRTEVLAGAIERIDHAGVGQPTGYRRA